MRPSPVSPPRWSREQLRHLRQEAINRFVQERSSEGGKQYQARFLTCLDRVRDLFDASDDLLRLGDGAVLSERPDLLEAARYLGGPPVSADDLDTLAGVRIAGRKRLDQTLAGAAAALLQAVIDPYRFPWLVATPRRRPTPYERESAIRWTAGLWAAQLVQTERRGTAARRQERAVADLLEAEGFVRASAPDIDVTARNLQPGQYCRETQVAGAKCDVPVMLHDHRLLLIECKVSNSAVNSIKRLLRETGGKAQHWQRIFGERAVPAAVLSGVFNLHHLAQAQDTFGIFLVMEHDLSPLADFLRAVRRQA